MRIALCPRDNARYDGSIKTTIRFAFTTVCREFRIVRRALVKTVAPPVLGPKQYIGYERTYRVGYERLCEKRYLYRKFLTA